MKRNWLLIIFIFLSIKVESQIQFNPPNPTVPSANIAKQSLEVSNDLYNGRINVSIPIYQYNLEGISFPIALNYSGNNGIKPDQLPSWVGTGWDIQAGGYIHRTVRGKPDEVRDFETIIYTPYNYDPPNWTSNKKETKLHTIDYSYFANLNKLTNPNWSSSTYAGTLSLPPGGNYPINLPWTLYSTTIYNHHPTYDLVPDEFTFSVGNISGKFYLNHLNKWIVQTNDGKEYLVAVVTGEQVAADFNYTGVRGFYKIPRIVKYITLTSPDGVKYFFGNVNLNASLSEQYFEYSHSSHLTPILGKSTTPFTPANTAATLVDIIPHTWHLTKVENLKTGSVVSFSYKQSFQFSTTLQAFGWGGQLLQEANLFILNLNPSKILIKILISLNKNCQRFQKF